MPHLNTEIYPSQPVSRRSLLKQSACGFGLLALHSLLADTLLALMGLDHERLTYHFGVILCP